MSIFGKDTSSLDTYDDTICFNDQMNEIRDKVKVIPNENLTNTQSVISIKDGLREIENKYDLSDNIEKNILETKIVNKSASLLSKSKSEQIEKILNEPKVNKVSTLIGYMVS